MRVVREREREKEDHEKKGEEEKGGGLTYSVFASLNKIFSFLVCFFLTLACGWAGVKVILPSSFFLVVKLLYKY